jgi:hypothetical protein
MKGERISDTINGPNQIIFRVHALRQMFSRQISDETVQEVLRIGVVIEEYPDDTPYPGYLISAKIGDCPFHVVVAYNKEGGVVIVITAYEPDPNLWEDTYTRRKP